MLRIPPSPCPSQTLLSNLPRLSPVPNHFLPNYSEASKADALFHYTTAGGLIGILTSGQIWSTAYYCTNDESELATGRGILGPLFFDEVQRLRRTNDRRVAVFAGRGVEIEEYARSFESHIAGSATSRLCTYITCYFRSTSKEDFLDGLLSQWRGYGTDGGYALQFSRSKLNKKIAAFEDDRSFQYDLQDIYYATENPLKSEVLGHSSAYVAAFSAFLDEMAKPWDAPDRFATSSIARLVGGPLESYLGYLAHTKNPHFAEERETRLSLSQYVPVGEGCQPVSYFNRNGLIIPYVRSPLSGFDVLDCIEWVVVGPGPRLESRFKAVTQLIRQTGRKIEVRASRIPFTRH
jgi:hypothetical protein